MPRRTATIDTSCLIALFHLGLLEKLADILDRVHIPKQVQEEISKKRSQRRRLRSVLRKSALYHPCTVGDPFRVTVLLQDRPKKLGKPKADRGEAEAVIQATQVNATIVLVDDPLGRQWAENHRIEPHGMIWVLRELRRIEVITDLRPAFRTLRKIDYRLPPDQIRKLLIEFEEA